MRRFYANSTYRAGSWTKPRRVIAKVEWHSGKLYPRVGFIVTNMSRPLRCEKTARNYGSFVALALGLILIKSVHTA